MNNIVTFRIYEQVSPTWTIVQTIVSPQTNTGKFTPAAFRLKARENDEDRKRIDTEVKDEKGNMVKLLEKPIEVVDPLFLHCNNVWVEGDQRDESTKLYPYVYVLGSLPAEMIKFLFSWTVKLFSGLCNVEEQRPNGCSYYRFDFPTVTSVCQHDFFQQMQRDIETWPQTNELRLALTQNFRLRDLAYALFDLTGPIIQCRNYDTVGSQFGMAVGLMASIIAECARAVTGQDTLKSDWDRKVEVHRLGNGAIMDLNNVFSDYLTSGGYYDPKQPGNRVFQLNYKVFYDSGHNLLIAEALDHLLPGDIPVPRPTVSLRPDWAVKYAGATLVTGEAKSTKDKLTGMGPTAVCAAQQLSYSDTALFMYMNSTKIRIVEMRPQDRVSDDPAKNSATLHTLSYQSPGQIQLSTRNTKLGDDNNNKKLLPRFETNETQQQPRAFQPQNGTFHQKNTLYLPDEIVEKWECLHPELRVILIAVFESTDILAEAILRKGNPEDILKKYIAAHENGYLTNPRYTQEPKHARRQIIMQDMWKYSEQAMRSWGVFFETADGPGRELTSELYQKHKIAYGDPSVTNTNLHQRCKAELELQKINNHIRKDTDALKSDKIQRHLDKCQHWHPYNYAADRQQNEDLGFY